jgi:hypothetical protein
LNQCECNIKEKTKFNLNVIKICVQFLLNNKV